VEAAEAAEQSNHLLAQEREAMAAEAQVGFIKQQPHLEHLIQAEAAAEQVTQEQVLVQEVLVL
jgi:hypothetical protein